ncbi:MAG: rod shape-determining protein RodA, partial [Chitinophagaceae bacterium]
MSQRNPAISKGMDSSLLWIYLLLVGIGIMAIFGATYKEGDPVLQSFLSFKTDYSKQFYFFIVGIFLGLFILLTDSKFFSATANIFYAVGIFMMLLVFPFHSNVKGTESIIRIAGNNFQPAEICKICVALSLAKYLSRPETDFSRTRSQLIAAAITLAPAVLSIMQKETGLALVFFSFFLVMYREGLPSTVLIIGFAMAALVVATLLMDKDTLALILTGIALLLILLLRRQIKRNRSLLFMILFIWGICVAVQRFGVPFIFTHVLKKYQVERIYSTIGKEVPKEYLEAHKNEKQNPTEKKKDTDYNVRQSKIAIGSGGLFGKGLLKGTQTRYGFVPEQRTD